MRSFEQRLERMVEGTFARVFQSGLTPLEIGRRITREMDNNQSAGVTGGTVVPNHFWVYISPEDHVQFAEVATALTGELAEASREHARDEQYSFMGPVEVELVPTEGYPTGAFEITSRLREGPTGRPPGALVLASGERIQMSDTTVTVGRLHESTLVLADPNVSRNHAEVRPTPNGYVVVDLGSTNGTKINGVRITEQQLVSGDQVTFGSTDVTFEAS